jgi:hypothetical protein
VIDRLQAWSLKRTAIKAEAAQDKELAFFAWQSAVANNIADPAMIRRLVQFLVQNDDQLINSRLAIFQGQWLLRLTKTNIVDAALVSEVHYKYRMPEAALALLQPLENQFTDSMHILYLKVLFDLMLMDRFDIQWRKCPQRLQANAELKLYRAAYLAGWLPDPLAIQGRQELASALGNPKLESLSLRLALQIRAKKGDLSAYAMTLSRLITKKSDWVSDHIVLWKMMVNDGRQLEAVELAKNCTNTPLTAMAANQLSLEYSSLGLSEKARKILEASLERFTSAPALWMTLGDILIESRQWPELHALALRIRDEKAVWKSLDSYSYFLEGRAKLGQSRPNDAVACFKLATAKYCGNLDLTLRVVNNLNKLGYSALARDFLARIEKEVGGELSYWHASFNTAIELKDDGLLLRSATRAYEMSPQDAKTMSNYAASLLILRQRPDEAVRITKQLSLARPGSNILALNHCFALLLNQRAQEAETVLKSIHSEQLNPDQANEYRLAWFDFYLQTQQRDLARKISESIDAKDFFVIKRIWYLQALMTLTNI